MSHIPKYALFGDDSGLWQVKNDSPLEKYVKMEDVLEFITKYKDCLSGVPVNDKEVLTDLIAWLKVT